MTEAIRGGLPCAAKQILCGDPVARIYDDAMAKISSIGQMAYEGKVRFDDDALTALLGILLSAEAHAVQLRSEVDKAFKACLDSMVPTW